MEAYPSTQPEVSTSPSFPNASIGNPGKPELDPRLKHSGVTSLRVAIPFHSQPQFSKEAPKSTKFKNSRILICTSFVAFVCFVVGYIYIGSR
jgi:hypothetical protein